MLDDDLDIITPPTQPLIQLWDAKFGMPVPTATRAAGAGAGALPAAAAAGAGALPVAVAARLQPSKLSPPAASELSFPLIPPKPSALDTKLVAPTVAPRPRILTDDQLLQILSKYPTSSNSVFNLESIQTKIFDVIEGYRQARLRLREAKPLSKENRQYLLKQTSKEFMAERERTREQVRREFVNAEQKFKNLIAFLDALRYDSSPMVIDAVNAGSYTGGPNGLGCEQFPDACQQYGRIGLETEFYINPTNPTSDIANLGAAAATPAAGGATAATQYAHVLDCSQYCIKTMLMHNFGIDRFTALAGTQKAALRYPASMMLGYRDKEKKWRIVDYESLKIKGSSKQASVPIQRILIIDKTIENVSTRLVDRKLNPIMDRELQNVVTAFEPYSSTTTKKELHNLAQQIEQLSFVDNDQYELRILLKPSAFTEQPALTLSHGSFDLDAQEDAVWFINPRLKQRYKVYPAFLMDQRGNVLYDFKPYLSKSQYTLTPKYQEYVDQLQLQPSSSFVGTRDPKQKTLQFGRADPRPKYRHTPVVEYTILWRPYDPAFLENRKLAIQNIIYNMRDVAPASQAERANLYNRSLAYQRLFFGKDKNPY